MTMMNHFQALSARLLPVFCVFLFINASASAQHGSTNINETARQHWIDQASEYLGTIKPGPDTREETIYDLRHFERNQLTCKLYSDMIIRINENDWVYFVLHSAHGDSTIGDIILAIDQNGRIYRNDGHVCGGTAYVISDDLVKPVSSGDFLERFYSKDPSKSRWVYVGLHDRRAQQESAP